MITRRRLLHLTVGIAGLPAVSHVVQAQTYPSPPVRIIVSTAAGAAALFALTNTTLAQDWPTRPVTMVVPYAAGGGVDVLARIMAPRLTELLGQQVIVENVGGAGGMLGASRVAKAPPDGYQFVSGDIGTHAQSQSVYKNPLYNAATDFAPVALHIEVPAVLLAQKEFPANNLREFAAYAKTNQPKMQFGAPGVGSPAHLACARLNGAVGINVTHVPFRGGGPALQDLMGGRIDYMCPTVTLAIAQVEAKTVNAIAVLSKNRSPALPNLASSDEQGVTNIDSDAWGAFFLPRGTPDPIVRKLQSATVAMLETPSVRERFKELGANVVAPERRSPEHLRKFVESEIETWRAVVKAAGVSTD